MIKEEAVKNPYHLSWQNLQLKETKTNKFILDNVSGAVSSGQFLSIMGPSGAGKSSFLSLITARLRNNNTKLQIKGQTLLNGRQYSLQQFSTVSAYVQQEDLLFGTLTVRQTFMFQARLRLWNISEEDQLQKCEQILKKLNLMECADTLIGNDQFKKTISGGQKKRVSIGVELISDPKILVFDEPTSGLDSHNALIIANILARLAKQEGKMIVTTIHQPSTLIFQRMDKLLLLNQGSLIYYGQAKDIVGYMEQLMITVDYRMNPADFFMLEISEMKRLQGYKTKLNNQNYLQKIHYRRALPVLKGVEDYQQQFHQPTAKNPYFNQFKPLIQRSFKNFYRMPSNRMNKAVSIFLIPLFLGLIYYRIGEQVPEQYQEAYFLKFIAFLFMGVYFVFSMNVFQTTLVFPTEKQLVMKDVGAGLYSIAAYYLARLMAQILGCVIPALINGVLLALLAAIDLSFPHFILFVMIFLLMGIQGHFFGIFFGVLARDSSAAVNLLPMAIIPMILFGGLVVNISSIPVYVRWLQYLTPLRHCFMILFQDQMASSKFSHFAQYDLPQKFGVGGDVMVSWICLFASLAAYVLLSIILLLRLRKTV